MEYKMLFTPMNIGTVQIKNRVVMPPMMLGFGQFNGCPTKEMMIITRNVLSEEPGLLLPR